MQLQDLIQECTHFRMNKPHRTATFPDALWDKIALAVIEYGQAVVCKSLNLNPSQVKGFCEDRINQLWHTRQKTIVPVSNPLAEPDKKSEPETEDFTCELTLTSSVMSSNAR